MDKDSFEISKMPIEIVSMNYRYVSVWNEVNSRIAMRQHTLALFVTLSCAIVTILITQARKDSVIDPNYLSALMPCVSIAFGLLNYKHDKTIALLRSFLKDAEEWNRDAYVEIKLLGYNSHNFYRAEADSIRRFHDATCAVLIILFNAIAGFVAYKAFPEESRISGALLVIYALGVGVSIWLVMLSTIKPHVFQRNN